MMLSEIDERIEEFRNYCNAQLDAIDKLSVPNFETLFKKKLYIAFLESLAKAAFPNDGVKKRFLKFLEEFTSWKECNHCCPVSFEDTETIQDILNSRRYCVIENFSINNQNCLDSKHTYGRLLYETRNSLVHQFQALTEWEASVQRRNIDSPFYEVTRDINHTLKYIELVFPNTFLKKLSEEGLKRLVKHCQDAQINPFVSYYAERRIYEDKI